MEEIQYSTDISLSKLALSDSEQLKSFSCGVEELDDFFHYEIKDCLKYKYLAVYLLKIGDNIAGVFTLMNDSLIIKSEDEKEDFLDDLKFETSEKAVDFISRQSSFPAINIGHLGISTKYQSQNLGTYIVEYVAKTFTDYS